MKKLISWRWIQYILPLVIWFTLEVLPWLGRDENSPFPEEYHRRFIIGVITSNLALLLIFYIHTYLIYPLLNKKKALYILAFLMMCGAYWVYWAYLRPNPFEGMPSWSARFNNNAAQRPGFRPRTQALPGNPGDTIDYHNNFGPRTEAFRGRPGDKFNRPNLGAGADTFYGKPGDTTRRPGSSAYSRPFPNRFANGSGGFRQGGGPRFGRGPNYRYLDVISPLIAVLLSICYRIIIDNRAKQQLLKERETAHLKSELTFLRSQISPHFMFNVLNNLVALARKNLIHWSRQL